jgi:hypothetical protein
VQKSVPVKLARLLLDITIGCCFDSHPRIDSVPQNSGFRYGLLENAIDSLFLQLEFFCLLLRYLAVPLIFMCQDCARPAIAGDFFQKSLAQGL